VKISTLTALIVLLVLLTEGFLGLRVWMQSTDREVDSEGMESLYEITDALAAPATILTGDEPLQASGVVDFTVLVAIEAYAIAALALIVTIVLVSGGWHRLIALRPVHYPDFVVQQMKPPVVRRVWQPVTGPITGGSRHYVVHVTRQRRSPTRHLPGESPHLPHG
jgi:hypothetical protein